MTASAPHHHRGLWIGVLAALALLCAALVFLLWQQGKTLSKASLQDGRTLVVDSKTADINNPEPKPETKSAPEEKAADESEKGGPVELTKPEEPAANPASEASTTATASPNNAASLAEAPNPALTEWGPYGALPIIAADGTKPWQYYARPAEKPAKGKPRVAILLTNVGMNRNASEQAQALPASISLSISPYAANASSWAKALRSVGHEIMLDWPMETASYPAEDPGLYALLGSDTPEQTEKKLSQTLAQAEGVIGLYAPANEKLSDHAEVLKPALQQLSARGQLVVYGHKDDKTPLTQALSTVPLPVLRADVVLDRERSAEAINAQLESLMAVAAQQGHALGVAQASPLMLKQLKEWIPTLAQKGMVLVPVSALAREKFS